MIKCSRVRSLANDVTMSAEDLAERRQSEIAYIGVNLVGMSDGDPRRLPGINGTLIQPNAFQRIL